MGRLDEEFDELGDAVRALIGLLEEVAPVAGGQEKFWLTYLRRGLMQIDEHKLAGATAVLGCFGGEDTFSDLVIGRDLEVSEPLRFRNLNARLVELRNRTFDTASAIASRRSW
ncbi:MAG: hypothetical protein R3E82_07900 [Pseudomonadales bacterium]